MIPPGPIFHKPKSFITAKNILYASICVGVLAVIMRDYTLGINNNGGVPSLLMTAAGYIVIILLIKQMAFCKKWARTVLTVWCILILVAYTIAFIQKGMINIVEEALVVLQYVLIILALIFLYRNECNIWFNSTQDEITQI